MAMSARMKLPLVLLVCVCAATAASDLQSLSADKMLHMLRSWHLEDEFASIFEARRYDGYTFDSMTKEDLDAEFPNSSPLHRRALYSRIQDIKNAHGVSRKLKSKTDLTGYTGVNMNQDKAYITFGKNKDITIYRDEKGTLRFEADAIDFGSAKFTVNGKPLGAPVNECLKNNGGCHSKRKCINTAGSMKCGDCSAGYANDGAKGCKDVNECASNNGGCHSKRTCTNRVGSMTCGNCQAGYANSGAKGCTDVNECASNNGGCDSKRTCTNTVGSMTCGNCPAGYANSGAKGCTDVNECASNNGGCHSKRTCTNTVGSMTCGNCRDGLDNSGAKGCKPKPIIWANVGKGECKDQSGARIRFCYKSGVTQAQLISLCSSISTCSGYQFSSQPKMFGDVYSACPSGWTRQAGASGSPVGGNTHGNDCFKKLAAPFKPKDQTELHYAYNGQNGVPGCLSYREPNGRQACTKGLNGPIGTWDMTGVDRNQVEFRKQNFIGDISKWDVSNWVTFSMQFWGMLHFNGDLSKWDVSKGVQFSAMFRDARAYNHPGLSKWQFTKTNPATLSMIYMFYEAYAFNVDISKWDVSRVTHFDGMFYKAYSFRRDLSKWDVGKAKSVISMFAHCRSLPNVVFCGKWRDMYDRTNVKTRGIGEGDSRFKLCPVTSCPAGKTFVPPILTTGIFYNFARCCDTAVFNPNAQEKCVGSY